MLAFLRPDIETVLLSFLEPGLVVTTISLSLSLFLFLQVSSYTVRHLFFWNGTALGIAGVGFLLRQPHIASSLIDVSWTFSTDTTFDVCSGSRNV